MSSGGFTSDDSSALSEDGDVGDFEHIEDEDILLDTDDFKPGHTAQSRACERSMICSALGGHCSAMPVSTIRLLC